MNTIMKLNFKIILFSMILIPFSLLNANDWKELVDLSGYWKFNIGDEKAWANYEYFDEDWDEVRVPSSWEDQGYHGYNGYAWYRKKVYIPNSIQNKSIYISLGYIDDVDEVYLNGHLIGASGSFPPYFETAYNAYRKYPVSSDLFKPGSDNVIAVRVFDTRLNGGITSGDISIMVLESLHLEVNLEGIWKFKIGDDLAWNSANYSDTAWDDMLVPSFWEIQGYHDYNGFAWYRKEFFLDDKLEGEALMLMLGKIDDIDECYLNGELIGNTGDFRRTPKTNTFQNEYQELRGYYISGDVVNFGKKNVLAVRVYDGYRDGGIYQGPIGITTQDEYRRYWKEKRGKKGFWDYIFKKWD